MSIMPILLKPILNEIELNGQNIQVYLDLDGVLVNFDKGFKKLSGGVSADDFSQKKFNGNHQQAQREFWKLINRGGAKWWAGLEMMPDGMVLWNFFKKYNPIILSAGSGSGVRDGKTEWVHKHLGSGITPIISSRGVDKWKYVTNDPNTVHVLIDDTKKNIDAWNSSGEGKVAILHTNSADSIRKFSESFINKKQ